MLSLPSLTPQPSLPHDTHEREDFCCWALARETEHALFQARLVGAGITHLSSLEQGGNPFRHCRLRLREGQAWGWEGAPPWLAHQPGASITPAEQPLHVYHLPFHPRSPESGQALPAGTWGARSPLSMENGWLKVPWGSRVPDAFVTKGIRLLTARLIISHRVASLIQEFSAKSVKNTSLVLPVWTTVFHIFAFNELLLSLIYNKTGNF